MRIKIDEKLSSDLAAELRALGHDVHTVFDEGLVSAMDPVVWAAAQAERRLVMTQDMGFADVRTYATGTHAGLLLLRLGNFSRTELVERVLQVIRLHPLEDFAGCFVVATTQQVRIRRPPSQTS